MQAINNKSMDITTNTEACLSFRIGGELFATSVFQAHEILPLSKITKVPHAPVFMKGVTNLRGSILPVIDTRLKFGFESQEPTEDTCIIVLNITTENTPVLLGALVDSVVEVFEISPEDVKPLPPIGAKYDTDFIKGAIKSRDDNFIMFLDVNKVFSTDELIKLKSYDS